MYYNNPAVPLTRDIVVSIVRKLVNPYLWDLPELQVFPPDPDDHECLKIFMGFLEEYVRELDQSDNWDEARAATYLKCNIHDPMGAVDSFQACWEYCRGTLDVPWPLERYEGKRLERRIATWKVWYEKIMSERAARNNDEALAAAFREVCEEWNRPKTYYERLYQGVEYDPYSGELVAVPEGSVELEDGSWLIPDVEPDPPEEAFGENGERLEPYSKEWNAYMRESTSTGRSITTSRVPPAR